MDTTSGQKLLIIEAFYGGSHKQLIDMLEETLQENCIKFTLPAKKWHWRARTSALYFSEAVPKSENYSGLFCSSVLNLAELIAMRPDLANLKKILYFHENQLEYPVRKHQDRDFQYGYNQILSCLVANEVLFNSEYNMESFLRNINSHLKLIPDHRPKGLAEKIRPKCRTLYFPMHFHNIRSFENKNTLLGSRVPETEGSSLVQITSSIETNEEGMTCKMSDIDVESDDNRQGEQCKRICLDTNKIDSPKAVTSRKVVNTSLSVHLHIAWPHRWEHDKVPEIFFQTLFQLKDEGFTFRLSVLGETYTDVPAIFAEAKEKLSDNIVNWGYLPSREDYLRTLADADVVVSTAKHEFFGVAMIEAASLGCYPLCPNRLVYPEIFPRECLYNTDQQLFKKLKQFCEKPWIVRNKMNNFNLERFDWQNLKDDYMKILSGQNADLNERKGN